MEKTDYVTDSNHVVLEVPSVARNGSEMVIKCRLTFDRDISELEKACEYLNIPGSDVLSAEPFKNCVPLS